MSSSNIAPEALVNEAAEANELFLAAWKEHKTSFLEFGRACCWIEGKELHKYIRKDGSRKGYLSFDAYVDAATGGDCSRTTIFEAKRAFKLTEGENAIPVETVAQMPRKNTQRLAKALADVSKAQAELAPAARKKLIENAVSQPVNKFAVTAQKAVNEQLPAEDQKSPLVSLGHYLVHPDIAEKFKNLVEDFKQTCIARDGDFSLDITSKSILGIITSATCWAQETIDSAKKKASDHAPTIQTATAEEAVAETEDTDPPLAFSAPDAAETIATATTEHRVVRHKSEARN
jgi:hypothetical protein